MNNPQETIALLKMLGRFVDPRPAMTIKRAIACIKELEGKIDNANMAASETHRDWKSRCYAIMAALGEDYGQYDTKEEYVMTDHYRDINEQAKGHATKEATNE